ncbi:MAG: hypothetical protein AAGG99_03085 [Pseudomonadota bacterium]
MPSKKKPHRGGGRSGGAAPQQAAAAKPATQTASIANTGPLSNAISSPGVGKRFFTAALLVAAALIAADILIAATVGKYGKFAIEALPGSYALLTVLGLIGFIGTALTIRHVLKRPETYYDD